MTEPENNNTFHLKALEGKFMAAFSPDAEPLVSAALVNLHELLPDVPMDLISDVYDRALERAHCSGVYTPDNERFWSGITADTYLVLNVAQQFLTTGDIIQTYEDHH